ncbi:MAG TPA: hypothetical protein VE913_00835 [Longimicrobium sp.]|nr:hypothetical protein [Longimicrobium sp.]
MRSVLAPLASALFGTGAYGVLHLEKRFGMDDGAVAVIGVGAPGKMPS